MMNDHLLDRHLGPSAADRARMLTAIGCADLDALVRETVPDHLRQADPLALPPPLSESECLRHLADLASRNRVRDCYFGQGHHPCLTPSVILRNLIENPQWYTPYTPYQPEISQGRLELLLHFQTLFADLTGLPVANASLLDEATAAAEGMTLCHRLLGRKDQRNTFFAASTLHPQTLAVLRTRAAPLGLRLVVGDPADTEPDPGWFGACLQTPDTHGVIHDHRAFIERLHGHGARVVLATDPLALCLSPAPADLGADVVVGSAQRFGMPMGFGGPHAAYFATTTACQRQLPGRIVGVSRDADGRPAYRLSLQTREQHIRRDKATSNICTAQALPAMVAAAYAIHHGPDRLRAIAARVCGLADAFADRLEAAGHELAPGPRFDTVRVRHPGIDDEAILLRRDGDWCQVSFHEATTADGFQALCRAFGIDDTPPPAQSAEPPSPARPILRQPVFSQHHSETEMMRYLDRLQQKDLGLTDCMIPLGSCTMKLNAATEMIPVTWPGFCDIHPYAPETDTAGYAELCAGLSDALARATGFDCVSLQPNAGSQGEYAGLLAIRAYHAARGQSRRSVCLIPMSAHGTNPASAILAGLRVVGVRTDEDGGIDLDHLRERIAAHRDELAALMVTYPSTHGVFEETIRDICSLVHEAGGQVYLDGANLNAMVGLCRPAEFGADVCHLNLHKTFCIPHGGGGPGMGPIAAAEHLRPHLPGFPDNAVSASPVGSGCILPISYAYIRMMGGAGLRLATQCALLNANYIAHRLGAHYPILYTGRGGRVAHECILDCRAFKQSADIDVDDIAKRLMDHGFHAPTMSWPVAGTLMVEPTESEPLRELDRFCDAMIAIRAEIAAVEAGELDRSDNPLKRAPHPAAAVADDDWDRPYTRRQAAWPGGGEPGPKYWPPVSRVDNVHGDRNLVCTCDPVSAYE